MTIDLGGEQVSLERIECVEALGKPFTMTVDIISTLGEIDLLPHLGKPVSVRVLEDDQYLRSFHGLITDAVFVEESEIGLHYQLTARPFTHFLDHNRDMAIFQEKTALDIIKDVFANAGASDIEYKTSRTYVPRVYCVQYRESDFAFITRLMEEEGLYYYYRHGDDRHVMVVCDAPTAHGDGTPASVTFNPDAASVSMAGSGARHSGGGHFIMSWRERVSSGGQAKVTVRDFDLTKPERPLQAVNSDDRIHPEDTREVYTYPAGFREESAGGRIGKVMLETMRSGRQLYSGESEASGLSCGTKVKIASHPVGRMNASYLIVSTFHSITSETYRSANRRSREEQPFNVRIEAIPAATPFHLPRETPKPVVKGLETAVVTGPSGEQIFTDEYGRVKVRFHWDRGDSADEKSTCWIRVAQFGGLGNVILPRVGQEVMIDFLHGDPDFPVVMGWVFNHSLKPVYALPAHKTRSLWRTKRVGDTGQYPNAKALDTGTPGANELRFEDKGGSEEVFLHAERDMNTRIRFEETHHVGATQHIMVGYDRTDDVGHDETTTIGRNQTLTVTGNQTEQIKAKRAIKVESTDELKVTQSRTEEIGTTLKITANQSITLECGPSSIVIDPKGVTIKGPLFTAEATATSTVKGAITNVEGAALVKVNAAIVKLN